MFSDNSINSIDEFINSHFKKYTGKLLFILGKGFDLRMNNCIEKLLSLHPSVDIEVFLIEFEEGTTSSSHEYKHLVDLNMNRFLDLTNNVKVVVKRISIWNSPGVGKRLIGDRQAADLIKEINNISSFTDIIVDISSLPRSIYFSILGMLLTIIDKSASDNNLFVAVSENAKMDALIVEQEIEDDLNYAYGFGGNIDITSEIEKPLIWFPIMGENKLAAIKKGSAKIMGDSKRLFEICPILPFPSKDPRRSDSLLIEYHELFFDNLGIESQNIMFTAERDPFQTYVEISKALINYNKSLKILNGCKVALSTFSSKLLSLGTLLVAHENKESVGILNVNSNGYIIEKEEEFTILNQESELFLSWLTGTPYS